MSVSARGPAARISLMLGVVVTVISFVALVVILGLYFAEATPPPSLYWTTLWGFPLGFVLMCLYILLTIGARRHPLGEARPAPSAPTQSTASSQ